MIFLNSKPQSIDLSTTSIMLNTAQNKIKQRLKKHF